MISIIIPVYNEAGIIGHLIENLMEASSSERIEIIIVDGGSSDTTRSIVSAYPVMNLKSPRKGRAAQMNYGASKASGDIFYFVHADTVPPKGFVHDIKAACLAGYACGRYRTRFNSKSLLLKFNAFFTRFDLFVCYGGDQTFFITRQLFETLVGFDESKLLMEDYDIVVRAKNKTKYKIMKGVALVSARKYINNSWLTVQRANYKMVKLYKKGTAPLEMVQEYSRLLKH